MNSRSEIPAGSRSSGPGAISMILDGDNLSLDDLCRLANNPELKIEISAEIAERVVACRNLLDEFVNDGRIIYGVTTGVGCFVNWLVPPQYAEEMQNNILRSVQSNVGPLLEDHYVRAAMAARINSLGRGYSAISLENLEKYVAMYNRGILPCIPEKGSLGTSGDLGPLACIALVGTGQWRAKYQGEIMPGAEALKRAGIKPMKLGYKEGLALVNGTSVMTGMAACLTSGTKTLINSYLLTTCMSLEALRAKIMPFDPVAHENKPHPGQMRAAKAIFGVLADSKMIVQDAEFEKWLRKLSADEPQGLDEQIEDAYSIRATPQVMGPVIDTTDNVQRVVRVELNSSNDNPLIVVSRHEVVHNANFHGQYISNAMDQLAIVLSTMCNLSDRRNDRLLDPAHNGSLPAFLCLENPGMRFGLSGGQFCATSLTAENRAMATPISIQSLPSTGDFQDHVSFGLIAARRTRDLLKNASYVVGFELLCACQAAEIRGKEDLSTPTRKVHDMVRERIPYLDHDEPLTDHIEACAELMESGVLLEALPADMPAFDW